MTDGASLYYLDSSALLKLVVTEPESHALSEAVASWRHVVSSSLAQVEVPRAARRLSSDPAVVARSRQVVSVVGLVPLELSLLARAVDLRPARLRSLDAVHLASALSLGDHLTAMAVYDRRLADAARDAGLDVVSPAQAANGARPARPPGAVGAHGPQVLWGRSGIRVPVVTYEE